MPYNHFDYVPSTVDVRRSVFRYDRQYLGSAYMGFLYPLGKPIKMMPGSSVSLDMVAEIRTGSLVAPLTTEIEADFFGFFVPNRIVWEHWKQFLGALDDVTFNNLTSYTIPNFPFSMKNYSSGQSSVGWFWNQQIACHFGIQAPLASSGGTVTFETKEFDKLSDYLHINALPFRGYTFIWNEYFRPEQIVSPLVIGKTDNGYDGDNMDSIYDQSDLWYTNTEAVIPQVGANNDAITGGAILPVYRVNKDLYTSCLPNPSLETLNLLAGVEGFAPVGVIPTASGTTPGLFYSVIPTGSSFVDGEFSSLVGSGTITGLADEPIVADLQQAILTVNNYRETIMLQNYYDALNRAGSRYDEIIRNIFHVNTSAALVDIPQLIIHKRFTIYRKEVVATAETTNSGNTTYLGSQAGYIDTAVRDNYLTFSSVEHGYLHLMYCFRPARVIHAGGIDPDFTELEKFDAVYYPQFDGMGDVARYKKELWYNFDQAESSSYNNPVLGYQEYGATWKWQRHNVVGFMDPHIPGALQGFAIIPSWFNDPTLNDYFVSCLLDFSAFADCLAVSDPTLAPQFIVDVRLYGTITHPMPTYNIPGNGALL